MKPSVCNENQLNLRQINTLISMIRVLEPNSDHKAYFKLISLSSRKNLFLFVCLHWLDFVTLFPNQLNILHLFPYNFLSLSLTLTIPSSAPNQNANKTNSCKALLTSEANWIQGDSVSGQLGEQIKRVSMFVNWEPYFHHSQNPNVMAFVMRNWRKKRETEKWVGKLPCIGWCLLIH